MHNFTTTLRSFVDPGLEKFLIDHKVEISANPIQQGGSPWTTFLFGFGPALLIIAFMSGCSGERRNKAAASAAG